jgi:protoporphyrin/coproporphyrin ferrochelatase
VDAPWPIRYAIVHWGILRTRPQHSAEAYRSIWQPDGSPLITMSRRVQSRLQARVPLTVELAMRYRRPSIAEAVQRLRAAGMEQVLLIPLFPHYAMSSYETAVERVREELRQSAPAIRLVVLPPYYQHPAYLGALAAVARPYLDSAHALTQAHVLFSFHGLPERHLRKADPTHKHCLQSAHCCTTPSPAHRTCYRAQCLATVRGFVALTGLHSDRYSVAFQSRLGREPWMTPYTDQELIRLARSGVRHLHLLCPAFVSDCLETLEEIGQRGQQLFRDNGGESFRLIPCLNDHPAWIDALVEMVRENGFASIPPLSPPPNQA